MFTGLVEDLGEIEAITTHGDQRTIRVRTAIPVDEVGIGDSIAVDGACLTVVSRGAGTFDVQAGPETLAVTTLGAARAGRAVHLERALCLGDRLDGHLVQGHVDGVGKLVRSERAGDGRVLWFEVPAPIPRYVAAKGSICVDGVSLTVNEVDGVRFRVNGVPHTLSRTKLADLRLGDLVNVEVDVIAKYVERLLGASQPGKGLSLETLARNGFA
jgi:riboflavin synthase